MHLRPRVPIALAVAAVAATALTVAAAAGSSRRHVCPPARAHTLAASATVHVYSLGTLRLGGGQRVYGCLGRGGAPVALTPIGPLTHLEGFRIAGHLVAYAARLMGIDTGSSSVEVMDLASGRHLQERPAASPPTRPESFSSVTALVLTPAGRVAWIAQESAIGQQAPTFEVRKADATGAALLDSGPGVAPESLSLAGHRVSWRDGSSTRTATLR